MKPPRALPRRTASAGFSLLEVMIALTLLSLLTLLALSTLNVGATVWNRFDEDDAQARIYSANVRIREAFDAMVLPEANALRSAALSVRAPAFSGGREGFEFTTSREGSDGGYYAVRVTARSLEGGAHTLELSSVRLAPDRATPAGPARREVLVTNLAAVSFSYLDASMAGGETWRADWTDAQTAPQLTRIILSFYEETPSAGAPLVFAPGLRMNAPASLAEREAETD